MTNSENKRIVRCPHCGNPTVYGEENPSRPFCCERCRLIDLGEWAEGKYAIPDKNAAIALDEEEDSDI